MCSHNYFKVRVNCSDKGGSSTVYSIQLVGPMADEVLQSWLMQKENDKNKIELLTATFTLCNQTCTRVTETLSDKNKNLVLISTIAAIAAVLCIVIVAIILNLLYCCCR